MSFHRRHVNKRRSVRKFKKNISRTKAVNIHPGPMRGGIRF